MDVERVEIGEREIVRTDYGIYHPRIDFPRLANFFMYGRSCLDEMVSTRIPLEKMNDRFDLLEKQHS